MPDVDLLALDEVLTRLAALDPQQSRVVELRFFGGLTMEETAEVLHISPATVGREWTLAQGVAIRGASAEPRHERGSVGARQRDLSCRARTRARKSGRHLWRASATATRHCAPKSNGFSTAHAQAGELHRDHRRWPVWSAASLTTT